MPRVLILPHYHHESALGKLCDIANQVQPDFRFHLLPPDENPNSPLRCDALDYPTALKYLDEQKSRMHRDNSDLLIAFYEGTLEARTEGFTNLFLAGSGINEPYPCNAVVSLQFIEWEILAERFNYDLQNHAMFHLVVCGLIGAYTPLQPHGDGYGCLLDFNSRLPDFNQKLLKGYYLCSAAQKDCRRQVCDRQYGNSIIRLCDTLRNGINRHQVQVVIEELEIVNGDKFENIGSGVAIINRSTLKDAVVNIGHSVGADTAHALEAVAKVVEGSNNAAAGALFNSFNAELQKAQPDKSALRQCWEGLVAIVPSIEALVEVVGKIKGLFL